MVFMCSLCNSVANHMGNQDNQNLNDFSPFNPFNQAQHYHSYCLIKDFSNQTQVCLSGQNARIWPHIQCVLTTA